MTTERRTRTLVDMARESMPAEPVLSFRRSDIERRIGFPAGRFTSPGPLLAPLVSLLATVAFYGVLSAFVPPSSVKAMFTERGAVPYVIVFLAAWSGAILLIKAAKLRLQRKALSIKLLPEEDPGFVLTPASAQRVLETLHRTVDDPENFLLTRRIENALANLRNMGRIGDADEVLRTQAENDEGTMDSSYTILRGLIWAIPVLGFIGTVYGLSNALGSFWGVVAAAERMQEMRASLQQVTGGLATAFETTLIALVAAVCIHLLMVMVRHREESFLDNCRDYCQKHIVGRLRLTGPREQQAP